MAFWAVIWPQHPDLTGSAQAPTKAALLAQMPGLPASDVFGPFSSDLAANQYINQHQGTGGGTPAPAADPWWVSPGWTGQPKQAAASPGQGWHGPYPSFDAAFNAELGQISPATPSIVPGGPDLSGINSFLSKLGQASTWIRVGEVLLGIILIAIGVARMTNAVPVATKIASKAGMVAAL